MAAVALICGACTGLAYANLVSGDGDVGNPTGD
jgi:hypothetical protein